MTYKIIRFFQDRYRKSRTIKRGLTLQEAQAYCKDPETSGRTCKGATGKSRTKRYGPWFDGYGTEDWTED